MSRKERLRPPNGLFRAAIFVMTALVVAGVTFLGVGVPQGAAQQDDLSARLESALEDAGMTVLNLEYRPNSVSFASAASAREWVVTFSYQGDNGIMEIVEEADALAAKRGVEAIFQMGSGGFDVSVNDVEGRADKDSGVQGAFYHSITRVLWARDNYFVFSYLVESTDTNKLLLVAEVIDDVLSGAASSGGNADDDVVESPVEPGLSASASPGSFAELGESVTVRVNLTGPEVEGKAVALTGHGFDLSDTTDSGGEASFTVTHDDETLTEYRFLVTSEGMTREVLIPVNAFDIHPEIEAGSGNPYAGVVADGRSVLAIEIDLGAVTVGTLRVATPDLGTLAGTALGSDGVITLSGGRATIDFTPPSYLDSARLTERIGLPLASGATLSSARAAQTVYYDEGRPWAAKVPLTFTHTDESGRETEVVVDVLVARAPVLLVHGFGGGKGTWAQLQLVLGGKRFDAIINEYYFGDQGVHDHARVLGTDISREIDRYASLGLKLSRVDLVGHSMGGLISREYTYGLPPHPTDVRKIIMVGTPNHGASFVDKSLGNIMAAWSGKHVVASEQLFSGSAFLANLNAGEAVGRHLNPDVQYGNIYGVSSDYVVSGTSAYLNGVPRHIMSGMTHSSDIPFPGTPITASGAVNGWVVEWLGADIPRAALRNTKAQVVAGSGDVFISGIETFGETLLDVTKYPTDVQPWEHVVTGADSRARIRLSVAGLAWGSIDLAPDTIIVLGNLTPDAVTVRVRQGSARFRSLKREGGGHFEVVLGQTDPGQWMTMHPDAKVIGLDTDFVVTAGENGVAEALVLEGRALFDDGTTPAEEDMLELGESQAGVVGVAEGHESALAAEQWWTDSFYRPSIIEVLQEWWAIAWSWVQSLGGE
ncbi:MAG: alpha/beta fold hydrolase [Actinomycetota bacterium]|jgi:pimeloyl-ACP methyl ester carboxylesterase|nr:alpha/beta fold hydrolase [Actinomycetota bacterium]